VDSASTIPALPTDTWLRPAPGRPPGQPGDMDTTQPAGRSARRVKGQPGLSRVRLSSPADILAAVPHLLGFHPAQSLVVIGAGGPRDRVKLGFRYDLPDPPHAGTARHIAEHAAAILAGHRATTVIAVGYGPGRLVTPLLDVFTAVARQGGLAAPFVRQRLDGLSRRDTLVTIAMSAVAAPDGHHIAVVGLNNRPGFWLLPVDGFPDKPAQLLSESVYFTSFSPDGKWIVYCVSDPPEVYANSVERPQERYKISSAGGEEPLWSPKGDRIVYRNGRQWLVVDVSTNHGFSAGKARVMFEGPYLNVPGWSHSFFPDGQRQLLLLGPQEQTSNRLVGVTNWFAELQRLAPPGGT